MILYPPMHVKWEMSYEMMILENQNAHKRRRQNTLEHDEKKKRDTK